VEKTTVAINSPVFLAQCYKKNCLVIEINPQANYMTCLFYLVQKKIFDKLLINDNADINQFIIPTEGSVIPISNFINYLECRGYSLAA